MLQEKYWHELFETGVTLKALNSAWEMASGALLLLTVRGWFPHLFTLFSRLELLGDRDDLLFRFVDLQITHLSNISTRTFVGAYLLFHGVVNMFLAYNLFRNRLWAYPASIGFVSLFLVYQLYRLSHTHSVVLLAVSAFDVCYIILTVHEYRHQLRRRAAR